MTTVVSIKFKNRGKSYFFDPAGLEINAGETVIVETANGLEIADCVRGAHAVPDEAVVPPLRPVVRIATYADLKTAQINKNREKEAFEVCKKKISEHGLDMKLIDVECNFEGSKTTFYFTSDGRVDFRELVKDLAGIFKNRIELRQIGVRDEAKMLGGLGMCGRPYCCHQFMDDFKPVSTKMAKVQNLSLNPTKISGSCGRLMCCLRYEQDAYDDLTKKVPRQGAYVETVDGYGFAVQVNLLRQTVKVRLDSDGQDDGLHLYKANEVAQVPGGKPKDGETPPSVLVYIPAPEEEEEPIVSEWEDITDQETQLEVPTEGTRENGNSRSRNRSRKKKAAVQGAAPSRQEKNDGEKQKQKVADADRTEKPAQEEESSEYKPVKVEVHRSRNSSRRRRKPNPASGNAKAEESSKPAEQKAEKQTQNSAEQHSRPNARAGHRRRHYSGKPKKTDETP